MSSEPVQTDELIALIAADVLITPGVVRLEPTLRSAAYQLTSRLRPPLSAAPQAATDGITVTLTGTTNVTIDIATSAQSSALDTAILVRDRVRDLLSARGISPDEINVNVLAVDATA